MDKYEDPPTRVASPKKRPKLIMPPPKPFGNKSASSRKEHTPKISARPLETKSASSPKVPAPPIESLDTIRQAMARDKLEEEHRKAAAESGSKKDSGRNKSDGQGVAPVEDSAKKSKS